MRLSRPPATLAATLLGVLLALGTAGCSDDSQPTSQEAETEETESVSPASPDTTEPTSTISPGESATSEATETSEPSGTDTAGPVDPASMLLPAGRIGKLNAEWRWRAANDFDTEPKRLVACHRAALIDVGAEEVAVREYTSDLDANTSAFHLVAALPDEKTAERLYAVLESWHSGCQRRLEAAAKGRDGVKVTDLEPVETGADDAATYVIFQPTATGSARIENVGIARQGRAVVMAVVKLEGQDFNYPRGRTPAAVTLRNAGPTG